MTNTTDTVALDLLLARTNYYLGVYYFTRDNAAKVAATLPGATVDKRRRGFVVILPDGVALGPTRETPGRLTWLRTCAENEGGRARLAIDGYGNTHTAYYFAREAARYALAYLKGTGR